MGTNNVELWQRLRTTLAACDAFRSDETVQALFAHPRLRPWVQRVPDAPTIAARVDAVLATLWLRRHASGEPAVVNLLFALRDNVHPEDALHGDLERLAEELRPLLEEGIEPPPFAAEQPDEKAGDVIQQNVTISGQGQAGNISMTGKVEEKGEQGTGDEEQQSGRKRWWQR